MEDLNETESTQPISEQSKEKSDDFSLIGFDADSPEKSVFKLFGYELIAPAGMKNPILIYGSFIVVNMIVFLFIKSRL